MRGARSIVAVAASLALVSVACENPVPSDPAAAGETSVASEELASSRAAPAATASCTVQPTTEPATVTLLADAETPAGERVHQSTVTTEVEDGGFVENTTITLDGALLMRRLVTSNGSSVTIDIDYGERYEGARTSHTVVADGYISGHVDGREIVRMRTGAGPEGLAFADGQPAPRIVVDPDVHRAMNEAQQAANDSLESCVTVAMAQSGHSSADANQVDCNECWLGCLNAAMLCSGLAALAASACGPVYFICYAAGLGACITAMTTCINDCFDVGSECCPVVCGASACCDDNETCLNSSSGLCCSPGLDPCIGLECCEDTELCVTEGPDAGCCDAPKKCGNTCCGEFETCAAPDVCCGFDQPVCGGSCCDTGDKCIGEDECCPAARACDSECCDGGQICDGGECKQVCAENEQVCPDDGGTGVTCCPWDGVCTGEPGRCCAAGEWFCDGMCRPIDSCVA